MIYSTVKTEKRANEILENWVSQILKKINANQPYLISDVTSNCGCGETGAKRAMIKDYDKIAFVCVCECCGDDDAFLNEVLIIK
jgi:hypothetical protein